MTDISRTILAEFSPVDRFYKDKKGSCLGQFASFFSGKPLQIFPFTSRANTKNLACLILFALSFFAFLGDQALFRRCESQPPKRGAECAFVPKLKTMMTLECCWEQFFSKKMQVTFASQVLQVMISSRTGRFMMAPIPRTERLGTEKHPCRTDVERVSNYHLIPGGICYV